MKRSLIATFIAGALTFSVYLVTGGGTVQNQTQWLINDAGISTVTHAATCPVKISQECIASAAARGMNVRKYSRITFPVHIRAQADGGRDVQLPPMNSGLLQECIRIIDWSDCSINNSAPAVAAVNALLGDQLPFIITGITPKWVRRKADAGLMCQRRRSDGGVYNFGDRNVFPAS